MVVARLIAGSLPPGSYVLKVLLGNQVPAQPRARVATARPFQISSR